MSLKISFLIFSILFVFCNSIIPDEWIYAKSPLTSPRYQPFLSKIRQKKSHSLHNPRITRGKQAKLGEIPHQVLIYAKEDIPPGDTYLCGGSIISQKWILTAAHCIYEMSNVTVWAGIIDIITGVPAWTAKVNKSLLIVHELYNPELISNDIGLINAGNITFGPYVNSISLPTLADASISLVKRLANISGWGLIGDSGPPAQNLQYAEAPIVRNSVCAAYYGFGVVKNSNVCIDTTSKRSTCSGDSGGPLTVMLKGRKVLVGIVSFGSIYGCELGYPDAFARVSSFTSWIKKKTANLT